MKKKGKDTPLSELTLRKYEKPSMLDKRELVKKLCLSLGLLQPGDSRDVIVDVFHALLQNKKNKLSAKEIEEQVIKLRKQKKLPQIGIASSNIRRQLRRLRELYLIEKKENMYQITELAPLLDNFTEKIETFLLPSILNRIKDYLKEVDENF